MKTSRSLGALALVTVISVAAVAQSPVYKAPRTPDGQPDLQGFWSNSSYVPHERPAGVNCGLYNTFVGARLAGKQAAEAAPKK